MKNKTKQSGFPTRSDTHQFLQSQKKARSLKLWIKLEDELYYPCGVNKGTDQLCNCWFSHAVVHMLIAYLSAFEEGYCCYMYSSQK